MCCRQTGMTLPTHVRGFLIDFDGTVMEAQNLVSGVTQALAFLKARNVPYRLVTNTTSKPFSAILTKMRSVGLEVAFITLARAT
jgi:ribonucleotide monophosphatase NagD (HAD superfamily)